jgi:hypothetical protein
MTAKGKGTGKGKGKGTGKGKDIFKYISVYIFKPIPIVYYFSNIL